MEQKINLIDIFNKILKTTSWGYDLKIIKIPIKEILNSLKIYIFDRPDPYGERYFLNQLIITTYFTNEKGEIKCTSEFTFPINGCYSDDNCCVYEF